MAIWRLGMAVIEGRERHIVGGVDTHKDLHVAAVVDEQDRILGTRSFPTTRQGYRQMLAWMLSFGELQRIGIESTGSYGAGLLRFMQQAKVVVLEVTTPDKQDRRRRGKNDDLDAQNAAHAALAGQRTVTPRSRDGMIESLRILMACRKTAVSARRIALQMIHNTIVCAPDALRDQLRNLTRMQLVRTLASWRPDLTAYRDLDSAYRIGLKSLARRYLELHDEIADLDVMIAAIVNELAPNLVARNSIGHIGAAQLLLTAGDNPERLRSEASFASLCGVSPVPASSGKTVRHRINRGGDRAANSALHIIAIGRLRTDQRTKDYVARRIAEGHSKLDAIRALKRYLAREVFTLITQRRKEINPPESPLDKQKGVRGSARLWRGVGRGRSTRITYTDRSTNTSKTVSGGTLSGLGQGQKVKIDPVPNTTVTVTNTSENLSRTFTAAVFNPPLNRVVSKYTILSGSTVQFGTESFTVSGTYTLVDTTVDYTVGSPTFGEESGFLSAVNVVATGSAGAITFGLSGAPSYTANLAPIWATPDLPATLPIPVDVAFSGFLSLDGSTTPFSGTLSDTTTFNPDGSVSDLDVLDIMTDVGPITGSISAFATPTVVVPEPSTLTLLALGCGAIFGLRSSRRLTTRWPN